MCFRKSAVLTMCHVSEQPAYVTASCNIELLTGTERLWHCLQVVIGKQMMVDPTRTEEAAASARVIMAMDATRQRVAHVDIDGALDAGQLRDAMGLALSACAACEPELKRVAVQSRQASLEGVKV